MTNTVADTPRGRLYGVGRIALAGLIWGSIPLLLDAAAGPPYVKVFFRVMIASAVVLVYQTAAGTLSEMRRLPPKKWRQLVVQALVLTLNWLLFFTALDYTTVATTELLGYTAPVFVAALAPLVTREKFDRRIVWPLAMALTGIVVILLPQGVKLSSGRDLIGATLAFGSAFTYATLLLRSKNILKGVSSVTLMTVEYVVASVVLLPFVIAAYSRGDFPTDSRSYAALIVLGVVHTALTSYLFLGGLRTVRTDQVAVLTYIEPVSAVAFAALFMNQPLTVATVAGGAMVISGGILVARLEPGAGSVPLEAAGSAGDSQAAVGDNMGDPER